MPESPDVVAPQAIPLPDEWADVGVMLASRFGWTCVGFEVDDEGASVGLHIQVHHPEQEGLVRNLIVVLPIARGDGALWIGTPRARWEEMS